MKVLYPEKYKEHKPKHEVFNGQKISHQEVAGRVTSILKALKRNHEISCPSGRVPDELLGSVHEAEYLRFLRNASRGLKEPEVLYPSVFPNGEGGNIKGRVADLGRYVFDTYTPISASTYRVALESASCAYQLASEIVGEKIRVGYALCRPPGHHAESSRAGGYCYVNNVAIAAEHFSKGGKVAVLDIDVHHGNGTQDIFYQRSDVLTVSIHARPEDKFPHFTGTTSEAGKGKGAGYNRNYPLKLGTDDLSYQRVLLEAVSVVREYAPKYLVVAFGADTHLKDPIGGFRLTCGCFKKMGETISWLGLPTLVVQEGGYNTALLGRNVARFLTGISG